MICKEIANGKFINPPRTVPEFGYAGMQYHAPSGLSGLGLLFQKTIVKDIASAAFLSICLLFFAMRAFRGL